MFLNAKKRIPIDEGKPLLCLMRYPPTDLAGGVSSYSYDTLNRLTGLTNTNSGSFGFGYDALGRRTSLTRPNGVNTSYTYDTLSRLLGVLHNGGALPGSTGYLYDGAGNRTSKTAVQQADPNPVSVTSNFSYDNIYELTQAVVNGTVAESYSYDAVGNRLSSAGPVSYNYNASNELTSTSAATYTYDNNGNTVSKTTSAGMTSYTWDFENRLASVTLPGTGGTVNFKYDPFGRRVEKIAPTATTIYAYDGANVTEELGGGGNLLAHYTQGAGLDEPLAITGTGGTYFYHPDGLGSITSLTDGSGQLAASYVYDSFGNLTASTGTITNPFQYTGREFDSETGLYYYRARYYDPMSGRFLSEDPAHFAEGSDFYPYVSNSPVEVTDPLGLQGVLGLNPFPQLKGKNLDVFNQALKFAKKTACDPNCDGALQDYGIKSLAALINQMAANVNVYDGRESTYPWSKNQSISQFLSNGTAGAVAFTDVQLTFLGNYFWNPTSISWMSQQRALMLLHEAVHEFGGQGDEAFAGSGKLSEAIADKCFPALKSLKQLGSLTN